MTADDRTGIAPGLSRALLAGVALASWACEEPRAHAPDEHAVLASAFAGADSAALRRLLDPGIVVQPPRPDTALSGTQAVSYLVQLAADTRVEESRLHPLSVAREGPFLLEQGVWFVGAGERLLRARYMVRWRPTSAGWKIVLLRWSRFR